VRLLLVGLTGNQREGGEGRLLADIEKLRADLERSVREACLAKAERVRHEQPELPLPTEATIETFSRWISTEAAPVANASLSIPEGAFAPGASRLVGMPDMPESLEWPCHNSRPLAFLAQIDLASLPPGIDWPAPKRGWLYFFLGANRDGIDVGNVDASPHRTLYFDGDVSMLTPRRPPDGIVIPHEFAKAVPYALSFELGLSVPMGKAGEVSTPWERFQNMGSLDLGYLLLDTKPAVIDDRKDRMFGLPRHDQIDDCQVQAAAIAAGYGSLLRLAMTPLLRREARHWSALFSLGSHRYRDAGRGSNISHFNWHDAQTFRVLVDQRRSRTGDFSRTFIYVSD
jgi:hypothetical protein